MCAVCEDGGYVRHISQKRLILQKWTQYANMQFRVELKKHAFILHILPASVLNVLIIFCKIINKQ
jgi:hypothetical protein